MTSRCYMVLKFLLSLVLLGGWGIVVVGCSHQWYYADLGRDASEVNETLDNIESDVSSSGSNDSLSNQFFALKNDPNSLLFYSEGPGNLGPLESVFSLYSYDFMGEAMYGVSLMDIQQVVLAYVTLPEGGESALMIHVNLGGESVTKFFYSTGPADISHGEYLVELQGSSGEAIYLRSFDLYNQGDLKDVIQLHVSELDAYGEELDNGKFSTLVRLW